MLVHQIANVRTGQTFKSAITDEKGGDLSVILPRDIVDGSLIGTPVCVNEYSIPNLPKHRLMQGDLLVVNKGGKFGSFLYQGNPEKAIATSSFFVITVKSDVVSPKYLAWYLNQPSVKSYFSRMAAGSTVPAININVLLQLNVPKIPLATQLHIIEVLGSAERELTLLKQLTQKRVEFYDSHIWECIKNNTI